MLFLAIFLRYWGRCVCFFSPGSTFWVLLAAAPRQSRGGGNRMHSFVEYFIVYIDYYSLHSGSSRFSVHIFGALAVPTAQQKPCIRSFESLQSCEDQEAFFCEESKSVSYSSLRLSLWSYSCFIDDLRAELMLKSVKTTRTDAFLPRNLRV